MSEEPLGKWISILYRYSMIYANEFLKDFGMSGGQLPFFMNIVGNPGVTQEDLSKLLRIDKSTTARAVKSLCINGFVVRKIDKKDKRMYRLYPTGKALKIKELILREAYNWDTVLLKGFCKEDRQKIRRALKIMVENALKYLESEVREYER